MWTFFVWALIRLTNYRLQVLKARLELYERELPDLQRRIIEGEEILKGLISAKQRVDRWKWWG